MRNFLRSTRSAARGATLAAALAALFGAPSLAEAQEAYPSKPIRFLCAYPAGSGADVFVRYFANKIGEISGATIIVENRPGALGNIAVEAAARAAPDGYSVLVNAGSSTAANMHLFNQPPVDVAAALQVVATINKQPFMLVVPAGSAFHSVEELTDHLRREGDTANYATAATLGTVMGEMYKQIAGVEATEVKYNSGPDSLNDLHSGAVTFAAHDPVLSISQAREGTLRMLAVSSGERMGSLPDVPTMAESGVAGMDLVGWFAAFVPSGTPDPIVSRLNGWFNEVLGSDETAAFLANFGGDVFISTPAEGQAFLEESIADWKDYVERARIEKM